MRLCETYLLLSRCGAALLDLHQSRDPGLLHKPADPFARDDDVVAEPELGLHPPGAVDATCVLVDIGDPRGQPRIAQGPVGRRTALPGMEPRFGDPEGLAHHKTGKLALSAEMIR